MLGPADYDGTGQSGGPPQIISSLIHLEVQELQTSILNSEIYQFAKEKNIKGLSLEVFKLDVFNPMGVILRKIDLLSKLFPQNPTEVGDKWRPDWCLEPLSFQAILPSQTAVAKVEEIENLVDKINSAIQQLQTAQAEWHADE